MRKSKVFELMHTDVCEPMEVKTFNGLATLSFSLMILLQRCGHIH